MSYIFTIKTMHTSIIPCIHQIFMLLFSCSDLQRPILRHKLVVTESTMWQRRKRAKMKSKSAVSVDAVLGFVVLYNWLGKQLFLIHQRASSTRLKNVWGKKHTDPFLYPEFTLPVVRKKMQSYGRFMSHQPMQIYEQATNALLHIYTHKYDSMYWFIFCCWSENQNGFLDGSVWHLNPDTEDFYLWGRCQDTATCPLQPNMMTNY